VEEVELRHYFQVARKWWWLIRLVKNRGKLRVIQKVESVSMLGPFEFS